MVQSPQSDASHESDNGPNGVATNKTPAVKDKECPYCRQRFTSSSLGRHLDQYLHKKKPDGIHNIEEIRRQRGGITRRTARQGSSKHDREGSHATRTSPSEARGTPPPSIDLLNGVPAGGIQTTLNQASWHSTGVINDRDIQSSRLSQSIPSLSTPTGMKRPFSVYDAGQRAVDMWVSKGEAGAEKDTIRALELALREVLDNLQAASSRAATIHGPGPFDFDIQSQTFPALCLQLLPSPPTLFSTSPFSTPSSFSLEAPGRVHFDALSQKCHSIIHRWKWDALGAAQRAAASASSSQPSVSNTPTNLAERHELLSRTAQHHEENTSRHLELAYTQWSTVLSDQQRQAQWQLELARAFVKEQEKSKEMEERLERVQQEAAQLQAQVEMLSRCQWPREMALWPPERVPIGREVLNELRYDVKRSAGGGSGSNNDGWGESSSVTAIAAATAGPGRWDFERLVGKWKKIVREDKSRTLGVVAAQTSKLGDTDITTTPISTPVIPSAAALSERAGGLDAHTLNMRNLKNAKEIINGNTVGNVNGRGSIEGKGRGGMRRSGNPIPQLVTNMADQDDEVRELNEALMTRGGHGNGGKG